MQKSELSKLVARVIVHAVKFGEDEAVLAARGDCNRLVLLQDCLNHGINTLDGGVDARHAFNALERLLRRRVEVAEWADRISLGEPLE
jgi:hypothetical protein